MNAEIAKYALGLAAKSNIEKRQVGCVIVDACGNIIAEGFNTEQKHAEVVACEDLPAFEDREHPLTAYVTHPPCPDCAKTLATCHVMNIEVVEAFMKFDGDKLRYDLIPPSATKALAEVITYGARRYKPNNWRGCEDSQQYVGAAMRHLEAYRSGEFIDPGSKLPHLSHLISNIAFLIELGRETEPESQ